MTDTDLEGLRQRLRGFNKARDWDQFHTARNLLLALGSEVGELQSVFRWRHESTTWETLSAEDQAAVQDELADVFIFLVRLADVLGQDLVELANSKVERNETRFPPNP